MRRLIFSATILAGAVAIAPGAYACGGSADAASPQPAGSPTGHTQVESNAGVAVMVGLLLGIVLANPIAATTP
jgi:hypothetical protein